MKTFEERAMAQLQQVHPYSEYRTEEKTPLLSPEEARQGVVSGRVVTILISSLMLALVAAAVLYAVYI
jgi:hypothetical protein